MKIQNSLVEICDEEMVKKLASMTFSTFLDIIKQSEWRTEVEDEALASNYAEQFNIIKKVCNDYKNNNFKLKVDYRPIVSNPKGRVYANRGLQNIWGLFKGLIAYDKYYDFDMSCAHHSILRYLCELHDIDCEELTYYVNNRDRTLKELSDFHSIKRCDAKQLYISSLNDERKKTKLDDKKTIIKFPKFIQFDTEIKTIQKKLTKHYPAIWTTIKRKNHDSDNRYGKFMSHLCFQIENQYLQKVVSTIKPNILMFDGFMIDKTKVDRKKMISDLNKETKGIVKWTEKEMDYSIYDYVSELDFNQCVSIVSSDCCALAKELLSMVLKDRLFRCNGITYFNNGERWVKGAGGLKIADNVYAELTRLITQEYDLWTLDETNNKTVEIKKQTNTIDELIKFLYIHSTINNDLLNEIWEKSLGKLYFNNGYWDFKKQQLCPNDGNTFITVERDLQLKSNPTIRKQIYERVLNPIFSCFEDAADYDERVQLRDCWLHVNARALAGHHEDKTWLYQTGERDCGKGVLCDLIQASVGKYAKTTSAKQFASKDLNSGDVAKELSFLSTCQFIRFLFTSEFEAKKNKNKGIVIDGNKVKMVASGGDSIEIRSNYVDEYNIKVQFLLSMFFNHENECCPTDALEKNLCFTFKTKFIDNNYSKTKYDNIHYKEKDDSVKTDFIKNKDVLNEFILILIDCYKKPTIFPTNLKRERDEEEITQDDVAWCNHFEITKNPADKITHEELDNYMEEFCCPFKKLKAKKYLIGIGAKQGRNTGLRFLQGIKVKHL